MATIRSILNDREERKKRDERTKRYAEAKTAQDAADKAYEDASAKRRADKAYEDKSQRAFKAKRAKKTASRTGGGGSSSSVGGSKGAMVAKSGKPSAPEMESTTPKEAPQIGGKYPRQERLANLPTRSLPKKKGRLRRAVSAIGRGFKKTGRGLKTAFAGGSKQTQLAKREGNQGKKVYT